LLTGSENLGLYQFGKFTPADEPPGMALEPPTPRRSTAITVNFFAKRGMMA
jgi:hypothetical protein